MKEEGTKCFEMKEDGEDDRKFSDESKKGTKKMDPYLRPVKVPE